MSPIFSNPKSVHEAPAIPDSRRVEQIGEDAVRRLRAAVPNAIGAFKSLEYARTLEPGKFAVIDSFPQVKILRPDHPAVSPDSPLMKAAAASEDKTKEVMYPGDGFGPELTDEELVVQVDDLYQKSKAEERAEQAQPEPVAGPKPGADLGVWAINNDHIAPAVTQNVGDDAWTPKDDADFHEYADEYRTQQETIDNARAAIELSHNQPVVATGQPNTGQLSVSGNVPVNPVVQSAEALELAQTARDAVVASQPTTREESLGIMALAGEGMKES